MANNLSLDALLLDDQVLRNSIGTLNATKLCSRRETSLRKKSLLEHQ
jgi:hypothetical protein